MMVIAGSSAPATLLSAPNRQLRILSWPDYFPPRLLKEFTLSTGIEVEITPIFSNAEMFYRALEPKSTPFDLVTPGHGWARRWSSSRLLRPFREAVYGDLALDPLLVGAAHRDWSFTSGGLYWLPTVWGSEVVAWRSDRNAEFGHSSEGGPGYADIWNVGSDNKSLIRVSSGFTGAGLLMASRELLNPGDLWAARQDKVTMERVWGEIIAFCIARKASIGGYLKSLPSVELFFRKNPLGIAQINESWVDKLQSLGLKVISRAPKEGALAWADGFALTHRGRNQSEAETFVRYWLDQEVAGRSLSSHGFHSAVIGAESHAGFQYRMRLQERYPGEARSQLQLMPSAGEWFTEKRAAFIRDFLEAPIPQPPPPEVEPVEESLPPEGEKPALEKS